MSIHVNYKMPVNGQLVSVITSGVSSSQEEIQNKKYSQYVPANRYTNPVWSFLVTCFYRICGYNKVTLQLNDAYGETSTYRVDFWVKGEIANKVDAVRSRVITEESIAIDEPVDSAFYAAQVAGLEKGRGLAKLFNCSRAHEEAILEAKSKQATAERLKQIFPRERSASSEEVDFKVRPRFRGLAHTI